MINICRWFKYILNILVEMNHLSILSKNLMMVLVEVQAVEHARHVQEMNIAQVEENMFQDQRMAKRRCFHVVKVGKLELKFVTEKHPLVLQFMPL